MNTKSKYSYYETNQKYSNFLNSQDKYVYKKYVDFIKKYSKKSDNFLDVGCGSGILVDLVKTYVNAAGIEVSKTSINLCKKKKLNCKYYNGSRIPHKDRSFNVVGSFNVLEHSQDPALFLDEQYRVLRKDGYLFVICPNFLSITNAYHWHTQGLKNKLINFQKTLLKSLTNKVNFEMMDIIERDDFHEDDDACVVTNPADILNWGKSKKLERIYWSSQEQYPIGFKKILDRSFFRYYLGASFIIFKKV